MKRKIHIYRYTETRKLKQERKKERKKEEKITGMRLVAFQARPWRQNSLNRSSSKSGQQPEVSSFSAKKE